MKSYINKSGFFVEKIVRIVEADQLPSTKQRRTVTVSNVEEYEVKYTYKTIRKYSVTRVNHESTKQKLGDIGGSAHIIDGWSGISRNALWGDV